MTRRKFRHVVEGSDDKDAPRFRSWAAVPGQSVLAASTPGDAIGARETLQGYLQAHGEHTMLHYANPSAVVHVCARHGENTEDDAGQPVYHACGMMWRCAASTGWLVEERQADGHFTGVHSDGDQTMSRANDPFEDAHTRSFAEGLLAEGKTPKQVHTRLADREVGLDLSGWEHG